MERNINRHGNLGATIQNEVKIEECFGKQLFAKNSSEDQELSLINTYITIFKKRAVIFEGNVAFLSQRC